jgi:hypothetical protein
MEKKDFFCGLKKNTFIVEYSYDHRLITYRLKIIVRSKGNNHLLEIRLLETGFLSRFQPNPKIRCLVLDNFQKKKI